MVMTVCTTLGAVILTPLNLTMVLAATYVLVDAIGLFISTLQVVVALYKLPTILRNNLTSPFAGTYQQPFVDSEKQSDEQYQSRYASSSFIPNPL
ncbi:hypothetical protein J1N35_042301 [Gossypium stocksii]|uniref:Uncharacterized protein n=1 Tax=Gossypium stocksii TaxID=47602 RepID=A0A9D3ZK70_9ROSI|nr:hypothetical protein J1N35_042301 [Gossypium stocksii]